MNVSSFWLQQELFEGYSDGAFTADDEIENDTQEYPPCNQTATG